MLKQNLKFLGAGEDSHLLVWQPPKELLDPGSPVKCIAIPLLPRQGGLLLAVPVHYLFSDSLLDGGLGTEDSILGPSREFVAPLIEEDDEGGEALVGIDASFLVVDVTDGVLGQLDEYDPVTDPTSDVAPYTAMHPAAIVSLSGILAPVMDWIASTGNGTRVDFYTARKKQERARVPNPKKGQPRSWPKESRPWQRR